MGKIEIDFKVIQGAYEDAFNTMKEYQKMGMADSNSKIIFNDAIVPAGYYDKCEDSFKLYTSILEKNNEGIMNSLPESITEEDAFAIVGDIYIVLTITFMMKNLIQIF